MQKYELNGETYYYKNGKWLDSRFLAVPSELCRKLNKLKVDEISPQSVEDLFTYLYQSNEANNTNTQLKDKVIAHILEKATSDNSLRYVLPRLSSFYRQTGESFKSIRLFDDYDEKYGSEIWSAPFFTSLAAAYCDMGDIEKAKTFVNRAIEADGGKCSEELGNVRERIKRNNNSNVRNGFKKPNMDDDYIDDTFIPDFTWDD